MAEEKKKAMLREKITDAVRYYRRAAFFYR